jgi:hypothetical protein
MSTKLFTPPKRKVGRPQVPVSEGQRFGRLTVLAESSHREPGSNKRVVHVVCDCGARRAIRLASLTQGLTTSCGCARIKSYPITLTRGAGVSS